KNPFATIDATGVGQLVDIAVKKGRAARANLKLGICGEHGGDPSSIQFFEKVGLDYVSCSPYRVPVARLAAPRAPPAPRTSGLPAQGWKFKQNKKPGGGPPQRGRGGPPRLDQARERN